MSKRALGSRIEKVGTITMGDGRQITVRGREMGQWVEGASARLKKAADERLEMVRLHAELRCLRACWWVRLGRALRLCPYDPSVVTEPASRPHPLVREEAAKQATGIPEKLPAWLSEAEHV